MGEISISFRTLSGLNFSTLHLQVAIKLHYSQMLTRLAFILGMRNVSVGIDIAVIKLTALLQLY